MENRGIILLMVMIGLAGCKKERSEDANMPEVAVSEAIEDSVVLYKQYPGELEASVKGNVVGEVSGRLLTRNYTPGSLVHKGALLFTIEPTKYRDAVIEAKATLMSARSNAEYYRQQLDALTRAYKDDAVSKIEVIQAKSNLEAAEADILNAEAALSTAEMMLGKCSVRAPITGYISEEVLSPGNYVSGEGSPVTLATIYDNAQLKAVFSIENSEYNQLLSDMKGDDSLLRSIPLQFEENLPHAYTADLRYMAPSVSSTTGGIRLIGMVKNQDNELKDGMYVSVQLPYGANPKAVLVRDASISTDQLGKFIYLVNDSDKVVYTPIEVGELYHDTLRVVEKGVKPGDRYVKDALLTVRNGMQIKPVAK